MFIVMPSKTKLVSIFIGLTLLIPAAVSAQQTDTQTTLQNQIEAARQEVDRTCLEYFGRSCDEFNPKPMPEANEGPDQGSTDPSPSNVGPDRDSTNPSPSAVKNQIQDITPQQGGEGTKIRVKIEDNEQVTESDDWNVHFGDTTIERKNIRISVPAMYSPNAPVQGYLKFSAPEKLEPGTYDVWISGDEYTTNRVEFTLLDDTNSTDPSPGNVDPNQDSTETSPGNVGPDQGSTEPRQNSTDNPTADQTDNAAIQAALDQIRTRVQMLTEQVFSTTN